MSGLVSSLLTLLISLASIVGYAMRRLWTRVSTLEQRLDELTKLVASQAAQITELKLEVDSLHLEMGRPRKYFPVPPMAPPTSGTTA